MDNATPNNVGYMLAGFIVFSVVFTGYLVSLFIRWQNLSKEWNLLQDLKER